MLTYSPWKISYFNSRVQQDIEAWPVDIYADFLRLVQLMELHGVDLRMPFSRAMGRGLFELRCKGREGIGRVFYGLAIGKEIIVLHSFIKKTQEAPPHVLALARKRLKEVMNHET